MSHIDLNELNAALTPVQFELLLRKRLQAAFDTLAHEPKLIMLVASLDYNGKLLASCQWHIGHHGDQTKSDILADALIECNRRKEFDKNSTMKLLEAERPEATPAVEPVAETLDDEIPF